MAITLYVKKFPKKKNVRAQRTFYSIITGIGAVAILFALLPFFTWQFFVLPKLTGKVDNVPVPKAEVLSAETTLAKNVQVVKDADGFSYFTTTDPKPATASAQLGRPEEFNISIPKLEIEDAKVITDSTRFDQNLGHFPGTAIPGQIGNSFITGHSVLPEFFDAKNYRTIFSHLSDLEIGDDISVSVDGKIYHYIVQYSKIVDPQDTSVLLPLSPTSRNLTLMSCVPPGTSSKRLIVISSLI